MAAKMAETFARLPGGRLILGAGTLDFREAAARPLFVDPATGDPAS